MRFAHTGIWLLALAVANDCIAHAQQAGDRRSACEPAMLVFDATGSMLGTRIIQARAAVRKVMPALAAKRAVGLVTYGGTNETVACGSIRVRRLPALTNGDDILREIDAIVPSGRTPLTEAVSTAVGVLDRDAPAGVVVLVTDGEENCGGDPCALGRQLRDRGSRITVHVIGFRLRIEEGSALSCLAAQTGGHFAEVDDTESLSAALDTSLGCLPVSMLGRRFADAR